MDKQKFVIPVIHQIFPEAIMKEAAIAFEAGADGVFIISHDGKNDALLEPAMALRGLYPDKLVGVNLLGVEADKALHTALECGLNMVWADDAGVTSIEMSPMALRIAETLRRLDSGFHFFGSVAFKYQRMEANPAKAAAAASVLGMIPTTSGIQTGCPPSIEKIADMRDGIGHEASLAIASGLTPDNVRYYLPYATHFLVSTGVSRDFHHFDDTRLSRFVDAVKSGERMSLHAA